MPSKVLKMRQLVILAVLMGATCFCHGLPGGKQRKFQEESLNPIINEINAEYYAINKNDSRSFHHLFSSNQTDENFEKLIELLVKLSEVDSFRDDEGFTRLKRGVWDDAVNKIKETYHTVVNKVKESATNVKNEFRKKFDESGFKEKVNEFFERVFKEFNVENMCRNIQKLNNVLRRYPIDDKISTIMSFLNIIFCELSKDSDAGFRELTENPKYERLLSEKDETIDFPKLLRYIKGLDNIDDPEIPDELLKNSSDLPLSKPAVIFFLGSVLAMNSVVRSHHSFL